MSLSFKTLDGVRNQICRDCRLVRNKQVNENNINTSVHINGSVDTFLGEKKRFFVADELSL